MLAYVFWHWSRPEVAEQDYEDRLRSFHRVLADDPPRGFIRSAAFRAEGARWLPQPNAYEDWYVVDDFAALGRLNDAAVSAGRKLPHDEVARLAADGTAGVYRLVGGEAELRFVRTAMWMSKPANMTYDDFSVRKRAWTEEGNAAVWQRQMALGPASEFCLQSAENIALPASLAPVAVRLTLITDH